MTRAQRIGYLSLVARAGQGEEKKRRKKKCAAINPVADSDNPVDNASARIDREIVSQAPCSIDA